MGVEGVINNYVDFGRQTAEIMFDDEVTSLEKIAEALEKGDFPISGKPRWIK